MKLPAAYMRDDAIQAFGALLEVYHLPLTTWIKSRMDTWLRARFDPAEIARAVLNEGMHRRVHFLNGRHEDLHGWLRQIAAQHLEALNQAHMPAQLQLFSGE